MDLHPSCPPRGFTLIEVLVALIIFSFGMLGAVGLILSSLQATKYSSNSAVAGALAREYGEIMQLVSDGVSSTASATADSANTLMLDTTAISSGSPGNCTGKDKTCTPVELLAALRDDWALRVKDTATLPQGRAEVCRDSTPRNADGELEWGGCDEDGATVLIKLGWLGKQAVGSEGSTVDRSWMTADRPQFALSVMGNLRDYVGTPPAGASP
ncbi:type IV pilus assembly protein PilV [Oryzisolibacter propanilivorax]|uniref:Type IV pilus assembly protein PilV n=1 Tax=Oryzisolibacter propanilivorax TaxID=1527607 RepID=A0A1G9UTX1_9BURK|nr:type IV pilus modification protein PilV [Oryzisolibacter propanilivorax]SDM63391.1 type IV pilus assembly protein PilV [Oryzisolibacter propanilivorax]